MVQIVGAAERKKTTFSIAERDTYMHSKTGWTFKHSPDTFVQHVRWSKATTGGADLQYWRIMSGVILLFFTKTGIRVLFISDR